MSESNSHAAPGMPLVEVSWGELIDKITILEIKERRLSSPGAVANVQRELAILRAVVRGVGPAEKLAALKAQLTTVNEALWQIEDRIRAKEAANTFDAEFIDLARSVYRNNDRRSALKREINLLLKSAIVEEKQYTQYD